MSYKQQEQLILHEHLSSLPVVGGDRVAYLFSFLCCPIICLYVLSSVFWCPLRFPHKKDVRFVFTSSCLQEGSCLIYVICVFGVQWSPTHIVLCFCFVFLRLVASFSGLSISDCPFGIIKHLFDEWSYHQRPLLDNLIIQVVSYTCSKLNIITDNAACHIFSLEMKKIDYNIFHLLTS